MSTDNTVDAARIVSANSTSNFSLIDLRLRDVSARLLFPSPRKPLDLSAGVLVDIDRLGEFVTYDVRYDLKVKDRDERDVLEARIVLNILFRFKDGWNPSETELRAFGTVGVVDIAHPYMREIVQTLTGRMGLPPLVLDIRSPEPIDPV